MRFILCLLFMPMIGFSQKNDIVSLNKLIELKGTDFVIGTTQYWGKTNMARKLMVFINSKTGEMKEIAFPADTYLHKIEQVKIDTLRINKVIVEANSVNLDRNKRIDWNDPSQIYILSSDGKEQIKVTDDRFFTRAWIINTNSGMLVVSGNYDSNNNGRFDKGDKNEMLFFDLNAMKRVNRL